MRLMDLLEQLSMTPAVPGREYRMRELILHRAGKLFDEHWTDNLGTLICRRKPRPKGGASKQGKGKKAATDKAGKPAKKVLIAAHIDQIGFVVRHVESSGFLRVQAVGGFDTRNLFARLVTVCT